MGSREKREGDGGPVAVSRVRGTQSFVYTMSWCWRHPSATAMEVLWRWMFGVGALLTVWHQGRTIWMAVTGGTGDASQLGLSRLTVTDPLGSATKLAAVATIVGPMVWAAALRIGPALLVLWVILSSIGRLAVLRRVSRELKASLRTFLVLQTLRLLVLLGCLGLWFFLLRWSGRVAVMDPASRGEEPSLVLYFAAVVVGTLLLFVVWALVSWVLSIAPLLAIVRRLDAVASLRAAIDLGPLRMKLVEINLVMGIIKVALVVLAMVLSACPLPFQSVTTPEFLLWWNVGVAVLYVLGSDFFHVARQVAYLQLWRAYEPAGAGAG